MTKRAVQKSVGQPSLVRNRIALAAIFSAACFSIIAARLIDVMVLGASVTGGSAPVIAHPMRADLVDRNGVLIARDLPVSDLYAAPAVFWDTNPIPMKYMMKRMGLLPTNEHRLPLLPATRELEQRLDALLARAGLVAG
jgi:dihydrodipicolinate synthase/N-acetylneuraminate lyase